MVCLVWNSGLGYLQFTQRVSRSDTGEDRTKASIVAQVVPARAKMEFFANDLLDIDHL
jgi:hypothetical protein